MWRPVLLVWWVARLMANLLRPAQGPHAPTPHVDAWSVAGKRFQLRDEVADACWGRLRRAPWTRWLPWASG